jgi:predicted ATPase
VAQYAECCRALKAELDVEPEEETRALYRGICDGREPLALVHPFLDNLPAPLTPLVGRERELAEVKACLRDPACRLLTLIGPGGIGKSRLALEAGRDFLFEDVEFADQPPSFPHGVYLVPLTTVQSPDAILPALAEALSFFFYRDNPTAGLSIASLSVPKRQLLGYLRRRSLLLILDSFEHVLPGTALVAEILRAAPQVKVLITSRARLGVQGECLYPVRALEVSDPAPIGTARMDPARRQDAVELFLAGARRVRPGYEATVGDLRLIAWICRTVQGIPLAILLAAAWMDVLDLEQIAAQIAYRAIDFLQGEGHGLDEGVGSMRDVLDRSWSLLSEREREAFRALSIFRRGFTLEAAQRVAGASLQELRALAGRSLLRQTPDGRYAFQHELLHRYAAEKLAALPAVRDQVQGRRGTAYAATLERWAADLKGPRQQKALAEIEAEIEEARAAWEWAVAGGDLEWLGQAAEGLGLFYEWRVRYQEGEAAFRAAADAFEGVGGPAGRMAVDALRAWAHLLAWRGLFSCRLGHAGLSRQLLRHGQELLDGPALAGQDVRRERAFLLWAMGEAAYWSGSRADARQCYLESLALYRALDDRWATSRALLALAGTAQSLGAFEDARQFAQDSLAIRRTLGDTKGIGDALWQVGWVSQNLGQLEEAERLERESIALARQTRNRPALARGLHGLGSTLAWQGEFVESLSAGRVSGDLA